MDPSFCKFFESAVAKREFGDAITDVKTTAWTQTASDRIELRIKGTTLTYGFCKYFHVLRSIRTGVKPLRD